MISIICRKKLISIRREIKYTVWMCLYFLAFCFLLVYIKVSYHWYLDASLDIILMVTRTIFKKKDVRRSTNIIFFYEQYFTEIT
jgi:hypothetical protein